ncbi:MAG: AraC family transcriptional regulator [Saprospirales bacterium]|nr:MAG: AraC family transcriptional regulator [Saprospirales bacterium]
MTDEIDCHLSFVQGFKKSQYRDSTIIIYSYDFYFYNYSSGKCELFHLKEFGVGDIWDIIDLDYNNLMIGSTTGLYIFNLSNEALYLLKLSDEKNIFNFHGISINRISKGNTPKTYWLSTKRGLLKIEIKESGGKIEGSILHNLIPNTSVHAIQRLRDYKLAVTTTEKGLLILERKEHDWEIVQRINSENFLVENSAHSIEVDELGRIWLGTDNGLYLVDLQLGVAQRFDVTDGLTHNEFNRLSSYQLPNGHMIFGGLSGYNIFDPLVFKGPKSEFSVGIHSIKLHPHKLLAEWDRIKPNEGIYSLEIPAHTTKITPLPAVPFSALTKKIFYRFSDINDSWRVAENGHIPLPDNHPHPSLKVEILFELTSGDLLLSDFPLELSFVKDSFPLKTLFLILFGVIGLLYLIFVFLRLHRKFSLPETGKDIGFEESSESEIWKDPIVKKSEGSSFPKQSPVYPTEENPAIIPRIGEGDPSKSSYEQRERSENSDSPQDQYNERFLSEVHSVISKNFSDHDFNVAEMAKLLMLSKRQLFRVTKEKVGMTPHNIIKNFRLEMALKLLEENPEITISELTYSVGMNKPSYLSKIFKEKFGMTIKQYKKDLKKKNKSN